LLTRPEFWDNLCVIVLFSPHIFNDESSEDCWELFRELKGRVEWYNTVTEANVRHAIRKRSDTQWSLIIFDDFITEMRKKLVDSTYTLGNLLNEIMLNLGHNNFHLWLCTQFYKEPQLKKEFRNQFAAKLFFSGSYSDKKPILGDIEFPGLPVQSFIENAISFTPVAIAKLHAYAAILSDPNFPNSKFFYMDKTRHIYMNQFAYGYDVEGGHAMSVPGKYPPLKVLYDVELRMHMAEDARLCAFDGPDAALQFKQVLVPPPLPPAPEPSPSKSKGKGKAAGAGAPAPAYAPASSSPSQVATGAKTHKFADVVGLMELKKDLRRGLIKPMKMPNLYAASANSALLYGAPGNGKTWIAKAAANEAGVNFMEVKSKEVKGQYVGQSEKAVAQVFDRARANKPVVLFLDEVDGAVSKKTGGEEQHVTSFKNAFLTEIDGANSDNTGVFIIAATNHPWKLEPAFLSRFTKKFFVPYPSESDRAVLLRLEVDRQLEKATVGGPGHSVITNVEYEQLAQQTEWFSGRAMEHAVKDALGKPQDECDGATHFRLDDDKWVACAATHPDAVEMDEDGAYDKPEGVKFPPLMYHHVRSGINQQRGQLNIAELKHDLEKYLAYGGGNGGGGAGGSTGDDVAEQARQEQERQEQERLKQERLLQEQEQERQEQERQQQERVRQEQEQERQEHERQEQERVRQEQERAVQEQAHQEQERVRQEQERLVQEQARIAQERVLQEQEQAQARDAMQVRTQVIHLYKPMFLHTIPIIC
jgi:vacuolar protein-sorting-associated protein 4